MIGPADGSSLSWRIPPLQPALLLLVVCAVAALNIYGHPSGSIRVLTIGVGVLCLGAAVVASRMYLVAGDEGVAVRFIGRERWLPWPEIEKVETAFGVRGSNTVRFVLRDGTHVDVPPSLLQPALPTSRPRALSLLNDAVHQLEDRRSHR